MSSHYRPSSLFLAAALLFGCVTSADPVTDLITNRLARNGQRIEVTGLFRVSYRFTNLYAQNRRLCVGLIMRTPDEHVRQALDGHRVRVSGNVQAEGCGREGFCDERLCGPTILTDVTVEPLQ